MIRPTDEEIKMAWNLYKSEAKPYKDGYSTGEWWMSRDDFFRALESLLKDRVVR